MANLCEHCNETFYSDTEYHEHKIMLEHNAHMSAAIRGQEAVAGALNAIMSELRLRNMIALMGLHQCSSAQAMEIAANILKEAGGELVAWKQRQENKTDDGRGAVGEGG